jgi:hypothetical protein
MGTDAGVLGIDLLFRSAFLDRDMTTGGRSSDNGGNFTRLDLGVLVGNPMGDFGDSNGDKIGDGGRTMEDLIGDGGKTMGDLVGKTT